MKKRGLLGVLLIAALIMMLLPISEADAAASASDFAIEGSTLVKYFGTEANVSVPDTVEVIGESAFEGNAQLESVILPESVKRIDAYAFWGCFNLTDITIPSETKTIRDSAFYGCVRLAIHCEEGSAADSFAQNFYEQQKKMDGYEESPEQTSAPEQTPVPSAWETEDTTELASSYVVGNSAVLFLHAEEMKVRDASTEDASVGNATEDTGADHSGQTVQQLPKYTLVDGQIVADQAFYKNTYLEELYLPEGITEIGQFSFARSTLKIIELPEGVTDICYGAFYHCDGLETISLPETVMRVEPKAFEHTAYLENFRESQEHFLISGGVLLAYQGNDTTVSVPSGVRVIAAEVFAGHTEIESVRLPDSVAVIGEAAFEGCRALQRVRLGDSVEKICDRAFEGCVSLAVLKLPKSVKEAGLGAFGGAEVIYMGMLPAQSYEYSATRLANENFRNVSQEQLDVQSGVKVAGLEHAAAELAQTTGSYLLTVIPQEDGALMEKAWERAKETSMPETMQVYGLQLTDSSEIPLTKLGSNHKLTITLPLPDHFVPLKPELVTLDRNGQLEALAVEVLWMEGRQYFRFSVEQIAPVGIYDGAMQSEKE